MMQQNKFLHSVSAIRKCYNCHEAQVVALDRQTCEAGGYCVKHGQESQFNGPCPSYVPWFGEKD